MARRPQLECLACGGVGALSEDVPDRRGEHDCRETVCETCDGTGRAFCVEWFEGQGACGEPATDLRGGDPLCARHAQAWNLRGAHQGDPEGDEL